jgi:glycerol-3-phosphate acyltransferase PlsX
LLGVNGVALIAHGRSDARAIRSAIRAARDAVDRQIVPTLVSAFTSATAGRAQERP